MTLEWAALVAMNESWSEGMATHPEVSSHTLLAVCISLALPDEPL